MSRHCPAPTVVQGHPRSVPGQTAELYTNPATNADDTTSQAGVTNPPGAFCHCTCRQDVAQPGALLQAVVSTPALQDPGQSDLSESAGDPRTDQTETCAVEFSTWLRTATGATIPLHRPQGTQRSHAATGNCWSVSYQHTSTGTRTTA